MVHREQGRKGAWKFWRSRFGEKTAVSEGPTEVGGCSGELQIPWAWPQSLGNPEKTDSEGRRENSVGNTAQLPLFTFGPMVAHPTSEVGEETTNTLQAPVSTFQTQQEDGPPTEKAADQQAGGAGDTLTESEEAGPSGPGLLGVDWPNGTRQRRWTLGVVADGASRPSTWSSTQVLGNLTCAMVQDLNFAPMLGESKLHPKHFLLWGPCVPCGQRIWAPASSGAPSAVQGTGPGFTLILFPGAAGKSHHPPWAALLVSIRWGDWPRWPLGSLPACHQLVLWSKASFQGT